MNADASSALNSASSASRRSTVSYRAMFSSIPYASFQASWISCQAVKCLSGKLSRERNSGVPYRPKMSNPTFVLNSSTASSSLGSPMDGRRSEVFEGPLSLTAFSEMVDSLLAITLDTVASAVLSLPKDPIPPAPTDLLSSDEAVFIVKIPCCFVERVSFF